jgi:MraZ protein
MLLLTGEYQHAIDEKGRVLIPKNLRSQIDAEQYGCSFYLIYGTNGILCLYPEKYFERLMHAGAPTATAPDEAIAFERISFALAGKVELDSQGRLLLNDRLRKRAGLSDNVTLLGIKDHIELWNSDHWERYLEDNMMQYHKQAAQARQSVVQKESQELYKE